GATALVFNSSGNSNTATGFSALTNNTTGGANTAIGWAALTANTIGDNNVALGTLTLSSNTSGTDNTAIGNLALQNSVNTSNHVCVGRLAGSGITDVNDNIIIGHHTGVHSRFGQEGEVCYIDNIYGANVDDTNGISRIVLVDPDGRLGTVLMPIAAGGNPGKSSGVQPKAIPDAAEQAMLNLKVQHQSTFVVGNLVDHFRIHDDGIKRNEVGNEEPYLLSFIEDVEGRLLPKRNVSQAKLDDQGVFVRLFD